MSLFHPRRTRVATTVAVTGLTLLALASPATAAAATGSIAGTVTDAAGRPLAGVTVALFDRFGAGSGEVRATTNARGGYVVSRLIPQQVRVQFGAANATGGTSPTGYPDLCLGGAADCRIASGTPAATVVTVAAGTASRADVTLPRAAALSGRLTDTLGRGIGGVTVSIGRGEEDASGARVDSYPTVSATDGTWQARRVLAGTTAVCFGGGVDAGRTGIRTPARDGYLGVCWKNTDLLAGPSGATAVVASPGRVTAGIDQVLTGLGAVTGIVLDEQGVPVAGAYVQLGEDLEGDLLLRAVSATTGSDGRYRLSGAIPGTQGLCVVATGFDGACPPVPPAASVTVSSFRTVNAPTIVLTRTAT